MKILPYQHDSPDSETVKKLCQELADNELDAVCFTTAVQVRSLFDFVREHRCLTSILNSFKENVVVVAVGKITAQALREEGIERYWFLKMRVWGR